jgi:hypothetical protein
MWEIGLGGAHSHHTQSLLFSFCSVLTFRRLSDIFLRVKWDSTSMPLLSQGHWFTGASPTAPSLLVLWGWVPQSRLIYFKISFTRCPTNPLALLSVQNLLCPGLRSSTLSYFLTLLELPEKGNVLNLSLWNDALGKFYTEIFFPQHFQVHRFLED